MQKSIALILVLTLFYTSAFAGLPGDKAQYIGGTATITKEATGKLSADDEKILTFTGDKQPWTLPYGQVTTLEYGQHAGRRVGATVALGVTTLGIGALPLLFSKKRKHYLTIGYNDADGKSQAAIFEVGKDSIRTLLKILEVRTGKKVDYEDEEAKKAGNK
jgi:hypothetical protein